MKTNDEDEDMSLAEVLRANSEMLSRMCSRDGGDSPSVVSQETEDLDGWLPDLINDIDESLTAVASATTDPSAEVHLRDTCLEEVTTGSEPEEVSTKGSEPVEVYEKSEPEEISKGSVSEPQSPCRPEAKGKEESKDSVTTPPVRPFAPFPSKVRQPKRLGIELGLYPDGSSNC